MKLAAGVVLAGLGLAIVIALIGSDSNQPRRHGMFDPIPAGWRE